MSSEGILTCIYQCITRTCPKTLGVLLVKLRRNLSLLVGLLVVVVTLLCSHQRIVSHLCHQLLVDGLLFLTHLLVDLILGYDSVLIVESLVSEVDKLVVSFSLLGIVSE